MTLSTILGLRTTLFSRKSLPGCGLLLGTILAVLPLKAAEQTKALPPVGANNIRSIVTNGNTLLITVQIPAGSNQVVLQSHPPGSAGAWKPCAVRRVTGAARSLEFRIVKSKQKESYRAVIEPIPLPARFYEGRSSFPATKGKSGNLALMSGTLAAPVANTLGTGPTPASDIAVESDIWSIDNNRLYFFNQFRGLQVFDVSNPDSATLLGTLNMPGSGEQMYVLDSSHVILLLQDCTNFDQSLLALVDVSTGVPALMTNVPVSGYVDDSRLVGTTLYLADTTFTFANGEYVFGTQIASVDFSNPTAPTAAATLVLPGWFTAMAASGNFLLAVSADATNYLQSDIACIDVSAGHGAMTLRSTVQTAGQIEDQFSLHLSNGVLAAVSTSWSYAQDPGSNGVENSDEVWLECFSLANPDSAARLGALDVGTGSVGAARFDSNRAYIASPDGSQPLSIIDFSDPSNPALAGQVDDPSAGQSFIFPLGNQLATIGPGTNAETTVSLFDVTDETQPSLLSQVGLGTNYSWSEAEYNYEAFTLLPAIGLIMIPYQSYGNTGASSSGIQLIDLDPTTLAPRGVIPQAQARRATFLHNRVVSVSGTDLLSADISDRDQPVVRGDLVLSWPVDQVFLSGGYILELSTGVFEQTAPVITVAASATPNISLAQWSLTNLAVLGAALQGTCLYLLQGPATPYFGIGPVLDVNGNSDETNGTALTLSVLDLSQLPAVALLGQTNIIAAQTPAAGVQALWPQPNTLVWVAAAQQEWFWPLAAGVATPARSTVRLSRSASKSSVLLPWRPNNGGIQMYAFDVADPSNPAPESTITVGTNGWPNGNAAFATNGLVYVGQSFWNYVVPTPIVSVPVVGVPQPDKARPVAAPKRARMAVGASGGGTGAAPGLLSANYSFDETNELDVVDFTDPASPTIRNPVNIPGALAGISRDGNVVYTVDFAGAVEALAYDGVSAYLIATLPPPANGFQQTLVAGETVFTAHPSGADAATSQLVAWTLANSGRFSRLGGLALPQPVYALASFGNLLGVQAGSGIILVDITNPARLDSVGSGASSGCLWLSLSGANGALGSGLWVPLGAYGVFPILTP